MSINSEQIKSKALEIGFHLVGITNINNLNLQSEIKHFQHWLSLGYNADMAWMNNPKRQDITLVMPEVKSIISVAINYYTPHEHSSDKKHGKISRYAWGKDYHKVLDKRLKLLSKWITEQQTGIITKYYADTGPIQDKVLAEKSGIGWIGKNGNLISRKYGSWLFLGEILTNLELTSDLPHTQHCGTCNRCIESCPTQAITQPFVVDANKCIAYHTIENRSETLPVEIANNLQNWVAGCDICQDVCPWNKRFSQETNISEFQPLPHNIHPELRDLAEISDSEWERRFTGSALRRIKPFMWRRNAKLNL
ncbi:MAG TPA: tRNA epoxyqueuosine(34) reductase QueG [Allocoleopsis sp.]